MSIEQEIENVFNACRELYGYLYELQAEKGCPYCNNGAQEVGTMRDITEHLDGCPVGKFMDTMEGK